MAFEVARLLIDRGEKVEVVGMIDAPTVNARSFVRVILSALRRAKPISNSFIDRLMAHVWHKCSILFDRSSNIGIVELFAWTGHRLRERFTAGEKVPIPAIIATRPGHSLRLRQLFEWHISDRRANVDSLSVYSPKPLTVPVIFFEVEFSSKPWQRISSNVETIKVEVDSMKLADDPHTESIRDAASLATIAEHLKGRMQSGE